jgi:hypothetical protein
LSFPSGSTTSVLPLTPSVIALRYRRRFKLHVEVDLRVITTGCDSQEEEDKNLKLTEERYTVTAEYRTLIFYESVANTESAST